MKPRDRIAEIVSEWKAPEKMAEPDARILTMPNIPHAMQGKGCQPRTIAGQKKWDLMRRKCYMDARYKCEACGADCSEKGKAHAHELFSYDYATGTATFERLVCLCVPCHIQFIHSGRMFTLLKKNDVTMPRSKVLAGLEHGFKVISEYNKTHDKPIYPFSAILSGLEIESISSDVEKLIEKYDMKFYGPINKKQGAARWQDWKMVWNGKEYYTPYADEGAWEQAMAEQHQGQVIENPFSGGVFDEIDKILKGELDG